MVDKNMMAGLFGLHDFMVITFGLMSAAITTLILELYIVMPYGRAHGIPVIYQALMSIGFFAVSYTVWAVIARLSPNQSRRF